MGEVIEQQKTVLAQASEDAMVADTMGGRMHIRWDETVQATPHGQIECRLGAEYHAPSCARAPQANPLRRS